MADPVPSPVIAVPAADTDASVVLKHDTRARFWLALAVLAQFVLLVGYIVFRGVEIPGLDLILGAEISMVTLVLQFFFGSSSGSVTKSAKSEPPKSP